VRIKHKNVKKHVEKIVKINVQRCKVDENMSESRGKFEVNISRVSFGEASA